MPAVALQGVSNVGGGLLLGNISANVEINGRIPGVVGTRAAGHGTAPHNLSTITQGNPLVTIGGIPLAYSGSATSCGHPVSGGSSDVTVG